MTALRTRGRLFWVGFAAVILLIAGGLSYLASGSPDGLDATTLRGCEVVDRDGAEELTGQCIARSADDHAMAGSPLADYSIAGVAGSGGAAGVIGVAVTLTVAGGLFWMLGRGGD